MNNFPTSTSLWFVSGFVHNVLDLANLYSVSQCFCADLQKAFCDYWYERFIVTIMSSCLLCILHGSFIGHVINFPAFIVWFTEELNAIDAGNLPCIDLLLFCHSFALLVLHVSRWILYNCRFVEKRTMLLFQCIASTITIVITIGICIGVCQWSSQCAVCEWVSDTGLL